MTNITVMVSRGNGDSWRTIADSVTVPSDSTPLEFGYELVERYAKSFKAPNGEVQSRSYGHGMREWRVFANVDSGEFGVNGLPD